MTAAAPERAIEFRSWPGHMEADYIYTAGVAGDRFFCELRTTGRLYASVCPKCGRRYLPPRLFCELCFVEARDWVEVPRDGRVEAASVVRVDAHGEPLSEPQVWGLIRFEGITGGLIHRVDVAPAQAKAGLRVRPKLKPPRKRAGAIDDIVSFVPV